MRTRSQCKKEAALLDSLQHAFIHCDGPVSVGRVFYVIDVRNLDKKKVIMHLTKVQKEG